MITKDNFTALIQTLDKDILESIADGSFFIEDYVLMEDHLFNVGGWVTVESLAYDEGVEQEAAAYGNLFCDADDFMRLIKETNALEF